MLFKEIIPVYAEDHTEPTKTKMQELIFKGSGTYSYHWALNG
jgi:hypothetical protein